MRYNFILSLIATDSHIDNQVIIQFVSSTLAKGWDTQYEFL